MAMARLLMKLREREVPVMVTLPAELMAAPAVGEVVVLLVKL